MNTTPIGSPAQAHAIMLKAITSNKTLDVVFASERLARAFRFTCYKVRTREKRIAADYQQVLPNQIYHEFDQLELVIAQTKAGWVCRVSPTARNPLMVLDADTGEQVDVCNMSPEDSGPSTDPVDYDFGFTDEDLIPTKSEE